MAHEIWLGRIDPRTGKRREWKSSGEWVQIRTPEGPVEIRVRDDGTVEVQSFGLQAAGGMGVVDRVVRFEFKVLPPPAA